MSESNTVPVNSNVGVEGATPPGSGLDELAKGLEQEGLISERSDDDQPEPENPDDNPDAEEDDSEKIALRVNGKTIQKTMKEVIDLAQKYEATSMKLDTAKKEITDARAVKQKYTEQSDAIKQLMQVMQKGDVDTMHDFVAEQLNASEAFNKGVIQYVLKLWEHSKMSPEQREGVENKKLLAKMRQAEEQRSKQDADRAFEYKINQWTQHIEAEVPKALKEVGLPDSEFIRGHIISTWRAALERGQNPTASAVAAHVKGQLEASKLLSGNQPTKVAPMPAQRPRATNESVGRTKAAPTQETGYGSWDEWVKTRGR